MPPHPVQKWCPQCGERVRYSRKTYCTKACSNRARALDEHARFDASFTGADGEACWLWQKATDRHGYGVFTGRDRSWNLAHRFAWSRTYGPIPADMHVLHHCDVPRCVRPSHLFLGTYIDNNADMMRKGRHRFVNNLPIRRSPLP